MEAFLLDCFKDLFFSIAITKFRNISGTPAQPDLHEHPSTAMQD